MNRFLTPTMLSLPCLICALCACDRQHLSDNYGRRSREFFSRQHVYSDATAGSPHGLDSEEAALIQANYRVTLGADERNASPSEASQVLLLQENAHGKP